MKRMFVAGTATLMAAAAFAAPAGAQDVYIDRDAVACPNGVTECVRVWVNWTIDQVNGVGPLVGDACEIVFPSCRLPTP